MRLIIFQKAERGRPFSTVTRTWHHFKSKAMNTDPYKPADESKTQEKIILELSRTKARLAVKEQECRDLARKIVHLESEALPAKERAEQQLIATLESIGDGFFACDGNWRFVYVNHVAEKLLGIDRKQVLGKNHWEVFPLTLKTQLEREYRLAAAGEARDFENYYAPWDRWFHNRCFPRKGGGMSVYFQDITARKKKAEALAQSEEKFRSLFENSLDAVFLTVPDGTIEAANPAACTMTGWSEQELRRIGRAGIFDVTDTRLSAALEQRQKTGRIHRFELTAIRKNGEHFPVEVDSVILPVEPVRSFVIMRDITERKRTEHALLESERKFRNVFQSSASMITISTLEDGRYIDVNDAFTRLTGFTRHALIGKTSLEVGVWVNPEDRSRLAGQLKATGHIDNQEISLKTSNGEIRTAILSAVRMDIAGQECIVASAKDITERKQAEEALRQSRAKLEAALAATTDAVFITDVEGRFIDFNDAFATFHRFRSKEACSRTFAEYSDILEAYLDGGEPAPLDMWMVPRALRGETATNAVYTLRRKDTGETWVGSYSFSPIRDENHAIVGSVVVGRDMTEFKRAEEALRASEERYRLINSATNDIIWDWDLTTHHLSWNEHIESAVGQDRSALPQTIQSWYEHIHPDDRDRVKAGIHNAIDSGKKDWSDEYRFGPRGGPYRTYLDRGLIARDANGKVCRMVGSMLDLTEPKLLEAALRDSKERYRTLFESIEEGFCVFEMLLDADGAPVDYRWLETNPAFQRHTGLVDAVGKTARQLVPGLESYWIETYGKVAETGEPQRFVQESKAMGRWFEVEAFRVGQPQLRRVALLFNDITERKKAELALQDLNKNLEQRVTERTELAEARTRQLQALAIELIESEERQRRQFAHLLHDDLQQMLAAAKMQLQSFSSISKDPVLLDVQNILDESLVKARNLSHELSPPVLYHSGLNTSLKWLVQKMDEQFGLKVQLEDLTELKIKNASLEIFLFRAVQELLFNTVKHAGEKRAQVVLSSSSGNLSLTVSDQGRGFDPHILEQTGKTGFGLMTIRERVRYIGGSLKIQSAPGKGSRFILNIPHTLGIAREVHEPLSSASPLNEQTQTAPGVTPSEQITRVLFVDDHRVMRQGLIQMISNQPAIEVVGEAENGKEAIEKARQLQPNIVVMDVSMPVMDGIEATQYIKSEMPHIRVIGLSMFEDENITESMYRAGAEAFVSKTASTSDLLAAIYGIAPKTHASVPS
jgi:PAS domain S-box-containing protein